MILYPFTDDLAWERAICRAFDEQLVIEKQVDYTKRDGTGVTIACVPKRDGSTRYTTRVEGRPAGILVGCTCEAGKHETPCKHAALVLCQLGLMAVEPPASLFQ